MFEYVASGVSILSRLSEHRQSGDSARIDNAFNRIRTLYPDQDFSLLYNAFTEKTLGRQFKELHSSNLIYKVHADSGGLQMISRNLESSPELRESVYNNQSKYSDIAMSFDEIPLLIETADGTTDISNLAGRFFDMENLVTRARDSGKNLKAQLEYFKSQNTTAQPLLIVQGNCLQTYKIWTEEMAETMGDSINDIGGLAMSPTSIGMGLYEDCVRAIALKLNPYNTKGKVHLLGIGAIGRMLPFVVANACDWYGKGYHISYDSTSHSRATWGGLEYYINVNRKISPRNPDHTREVYEDMRQNLGDGIMSFEDLQHLCTSRCSFQRYCEVSGTDKDETSHNEYITMIGEFLCSSIMNFMKAIDKSMKEVDNTDNAQIKLLKTMSDINSIEDGEHWLLDNKKYLNSKPVLKTTERMAGLTDFY